MDYFDKFITELEKRLDGKRYVPNTQPPKTRCRDMLNTLVSESYDAGDVLIVPKRVIISIEEGIID